MGKRKLLRKYADEMEHPINAIIKHSKIFPRLDISAKLSSHLMEKKQRKPCNENESRFNSVNKLFPTTRQEKEETRK